MPEQSHREVGRSASADPLLVGPNSLTACVLRYQCHLRSLADRIFHFQPCWSMLCCEYSDTLLGTRVADRVAVLWMGVQPNAPGGKGPDR
jgi:hypothetical protein